MCTRSKSFFVFSEDINMGQSLGHIAIWAHFPRPVSIQIGYTFTNKQKHGFQMLRRRGTLWHHFVKFVSCCVFVSGGVRSRGGSHVCEERLSSSPWPRINKLSYSIWVSPRCCSAPVASVPLAHGQAHKLAAWAKYFEVVWMCMCVCNVVLYRFLTYGVQTGAKYNLESARLELCFGVVLQFIQCAQCIQCQMY